MKGLSALLTSSGTVQIFVIYASNLLIVFFPQFTMHSDLGKIVQNLLEEFWKNPPTLAPASGTFP